MLSSCVVGVAYFLAVPVAAGVPPSYLANSQPSGSAGDSILELAREMQEQQPSGAISDLAKRSRSIDAEDYLKPPGSLEEMLTGVVPVQPIGQDSSRPRTLGEMLSAPVQMVDGLDGQSGATIPESDLRAINNLPPKLLDDALMVLEEGPNGGMQSFEISIPSGMEQPNMEHLDMLMPGWDGANADPFVSSIGGEFDMGQDVLQHTLRQMGLTTPADAASEACKDDARKLCPAAESPVHCLGLAVKKNGVQVSTKCQKKVQASIPFACSVEIAALKCDGMSTPIMGCLEAQSSRLTATCKDSITITRKMISAINLHPSIQNLMALAASKWTVTLCFWNLVELALFVAAVYFLSRNCSVTRVKWMFDGFLGSREVRSVSIPGFIVSTAAELGLAQPYGKNNRQERDLEEMLSV